MPRRRAYVGRLHTFNDEAEYENYVRGRDPPPPPAAGKKEEPPSGTPWWVWGGLAAVLLGVIGGLGGYALKKRRRRKRRPSYVATATLAQIAPYQTTPAGPIAEQRIYRRQSWESISSEESLHENPGMVTTLEGGHVCEPHYRPPAPASFDRTCGCPDDDVKVTVKITPGEDGGQFPFVTVNGLPAR